MQLIPLDGFSLVGPVTLGDPMSSLQEPRRMAGVWLTLLLLIIWLLDARVAAYIDPGTGTMMFQLMVVLATGAAMAIRSYWRTLKKRIQVLRWRRWQKPEDEAFGQKNSDDLS